MEIITVWNRAVGRRGCEAPWWVIGLFNFTEVQLTRFWKLIRLEMMLIYLMWIYGKFISTTRVWPMNLGGRRDATRDNAWRTKETDVWSLRAEIMCSVLMTAIVLRGRCRGTIIELADSCDLMAARHQVQDVNKINSYTSRAGQTRYQSKIRISSNKVFYSNETGSHAND